MFTVLLEHLRAFKKPTECGLSKNSIFSEIKNLRKIALRDFGYFSCFYIADHSIIIRIAVNTNLKSNSS